MSLFKDLFKVVLIKINVIHEIKKYYKKLKIIRSLLNPFSHLNPHL